MNLLITMVGLALVALIAGFVTWKKDIRKPTKRVRSLQSAGASFVAVALVLAGGTFVSSATETRLNVGHGHYATVSSEVSYDSVDELIARVKERAAAGDFNRLTSQNVGWDKNPKAAIEKPRFYAYDAPQGSNNFGPNPGFTDKTRADEALETYVYVMLTDPLNAAASYQMRGVVAEEGRIYYSVKGANAYAQRIAGNFSDREAAVRDYLRSLQFEKAVLGDLHYRYNTLGMTPGADPSVMPGLHQFDNLPFMDLTLIIPTKPSNDDEKEGVMLLRTDCLFQPSIPVAPENVSQFKNVPKTEAKQQPEPSKSLITVSPPSTKTTEKTTTETTPKTTEPSTTTKTTEPSTSTTTKTTEPSTSTTPKTTEPTTSTKTTTPKTTEPSTTTKTTEPSTSTTTKTTEPSTSTTPKTTEPSTTTKTTEPSTSTTTKTTEPSTSTTPKTTEPTTTSLTPKDGTEDSANNGDAPAPQAPTITVENPEPEPPAESTETMPDEPTNQAPPEPTTIPREPAEDETEVVIPPNEGAEPEAPVEGIFNPWFEANPSYEESNANTSAHIENVAPVPAPAVSDPIVHEEFNNNPIVVEDNPSGPAEVASYEENVADASIQDTYVPENAAPTPLQEEIAYVTPVIPEDTPPAVAESLSEPIPVVTNGEVISGAIELSSVSESTNNEFLKGVAALVALFVFLAGFVLWRRRFN